MADAGAPNVYRSTTFRMAATYSLAFTLIAAVLGVWMYSAVQAELFNELDQRILAERRALLREGSGGEAALIAAVRDHATHGRNDIFYSIVDGAGRLVAGSALERAPTPGWLRVRFRGERGVLDTGVAVATPIYTGHMLVVGADPESIEDLDHHMRSVFAWSFGAVIAVGVGGGFVLSAALRRRLGAITATAEAIIGGDLARRMKVDGRGDEFDRLSATLNRMLDRIEALLANLRQVSSDIAHDLRTPLTRLRRELERAAAEGAGIVELRRAVFDAGRHADDLLELFTAILSISQLEAGGRALRTKRFDLSALVVDIADSYVLAAEDKRRRLTRDVAPGIEVDGQSELIAQLLVNLLDNALRHTPEGALIAVGLLAEGERAILTVADDGLGIPSEDRERVFERFVRLEHSRTSPGHGLGLRLVAAIAAAHKATVALEDNHPGVKVVVAFDTRRL